MNEISRSDVSGNERAGASETPRILLVAPSPPPYGGMALQARLLERLLRKDGQSVVFFASNFPLPGWLRFMEHFPGLRTTVRITMMVPKLWAETGRAQVVHVLAASWWYFFLVVAPAVIVARARGKRVILNYRGGEAERFFQSYGWAAAPIFRAAQMVTAPSEFLAGPIRKRFGVSVSIVPNILDSCMFPFRERLTLRPRMLVTRHLESTYDIETVLKAFRLVQARHPDASLWIAGTGSQEALLRDLVSAWNLQNVRFLGHTPHQDLRAVYDQCDILLNASRIDNFPAALIEASAAGLVVVSTCAGGIPSIYRHEETALLVEIGEWQAMAEAVERVLEPHVLGLELIRAALRLARACDWSEVSKCLYRAYGFAPGTGGAGNRRATHQAGGH
jgi:glycosyltransferase involved in cell wall biosynthesis